MNPQYTFLPYYRKGLSNQAMIDPDELSRPFVKVKLELNVGLEVEKQVQLLAPQDISGINPNAIIKTYPLPNSLEMMPGDLAYLEFYEEDLPWRFSPGMPSNERLLPWLSLLAFKEEEIDEENYQSFPLPSFSATSPMLVQEVFNQAWAFAHVQINKTSNDQDLNPGQYLQDNPNRCLSRVLCPRRLDSGTRYIAFLVPTFRAGQLAGLGEPLDGVGVHDLSVPTEYFPYYYRWEFTTAQHGDFEVMARRLKPVASTAIELPKLNIRNLSVQMGLGELPNSELDMPSLFMPPGKTIVPFQATKVMNTLVKQLNWSQISETPVFRLIPFYGRNCQATAQVSATSNDWLSTINLDPRYRAIAQIGRKIVRENQETFMNWAWDQAGEAIEDLNRKMQIAQFASRASQSIWKKHMATRDGDELLGFSRPLHTKIGVKIDEEVASLAHRVQYSKLSRGSSDPAFQKLIRKAKIPKNRKLINEWVKSIRNEEAKAATSRNPLSIGAIQISETNNASYAQSTNPNATANTLTNLDAVDGHEPKVFVVEQEIEIFPEGDLQDQSNNDPIKEILKNVTDPEARQKAIINSEFTINLGEEDTLQPQGFVPSFSGTDIYRYLKKTNPELVLPKVNEIPADTVMVLEPNPSFIEALMVGVNQEMSEELRWREYPANLIATYFRRFWDYTDSEDDPQNDIIPIQDWGLDTQLGTHLLASNLSKSMVVLIKSSLLEKFPNTVLYLQRAIYHLNGKTDLSKSDSPVFPSFRTVLEPDILLLRFDGMEAAALRGSRNDPGWFFVFEERPGEVRFGLDQSNEEFKSWDDLNWEQITGEILEMDAPLNPTDSSDRHWNTDAAQLAWILFQKPVRIAIHGSDLV